MEALGEMGGSVFEGITNRPRVIVAQVGARRNYAVAVTLHRYGCLTSLYTDFCLCGWRAKLAEMLVRGESRLAGQFRRRTVHGIPPQRVRSAWATTLLPRLRRLQGRATSQYQDALFGRAMRRWGFGGANMVYAMFGNGELFLDVAKTRGLKVVIDIFGTPIGHRIQCAERTRYPDWGESARMPAGDVEQIEDKVHRCIALADVLLCPSQTVVEGLRAYGERAAQKAVVLPYGHSTCFRAQPKPVPGRVLFAGSASLLKGIHYLAFAANNLRDAGRKYEFRVAGRATEQVRRHSEAHNLRFLGHLSRQHMDAEFLRADVFVLPTLAEGSASVIYEALAAGIPVVTTRSAGSVVTDSVEGFIVPERDSEALARAVERIVEDRELRWCMSAAALATVREYNVERWGERLVELFRHLV